VSTPEPDPTLDQQIERSDLDGLTRRVDAMAESRDWPALLELRDRCRAALERGHQLWPVASYAEFRLALDGDARHAAAVLVDGTGHLALGPLPEVAAQRHTWEELWPWVEPGAPSTFCAHERVVRGEDLTGAEKVDERLLDLPLALQRWEPSYPVATYHSDRVEAPPPDLPPLHPTNLPEPGREEADPASTEALADLVRVWTTESDGRAETISVVGDAPSALASLGLSSARIVEVSLDQALGAMAWAAASGGAHGRRRGMAAGRFGAWWALAVLTDLADEWPVPPGDLGRAGQDLRWFLWDPGAPMLGWSLNLAVDDPVDGIAWALTANDMA
jgi:hypothetical protein